MGSPSALQQNTEYGAVGFVAGEAIAQYAAVKLGAVANTVENGDATTDIIIGIALQPATAGEATAGKRILIMTKVGAKVPMRLGDTVTIHLPLMIDAAAPGLLVPHTGTNARVGFALEAGGDGDVVQGFFSPAVGTPA